jgi:C1A family cysteine protease
MKVCLVVLLSILGMSFALSDEELFSQFIVQYKKSYSADEYPLRLKNFKESIRRSSEKNAQSRSATYGVTKFSDMSVEEFKNTVLMSKPIDPNSRDLSRGTLQQFEGTLPTVFDWRPKGLVTPVKDQGQCGSCWAFSATENIESMWIKAGKATNNTINLAEQQLVDCDWTSNGCNGGMTSSAYYSIMYNGGQMSDYAYPYTAEDGSCQFAASQVVATISDWKYATITWNEAEVQNSLVNWGPLSICVEADTWQDYVSGIVTADECCGPLCQLDHCVQLVGYNAANATAPYWIVRNSWNTDWGLQGYIWLEMNTNTCGITDDATCVII